MKKVITSIIVLFMLSILTAFIIQRAQEYQTQNVSLVQNTSRQVFNLNQLAGEWEWIQTDRSLVEYVRPRVIGDFVLTIDESGRLQSTTDCNGVSGSVIVNDSMMSIGSLSTTEMFCEGDILESVYVTDLARAFSFEIHDEILIIDLVQNSGQMIFAPVE